MTEFSSENLKIEAAQHLADLHIGNDLLGGQARELTILAMCSFACKITAREVAQLFTACAKEEATK